MSKKIIEFSKYRIKKYPEQNNPVKDNFIQKIALLHNDCMEDIQKSNDYLNATDKKLQLRNLLITKYNADEKVVDELIKVTSDLIAFEFELVNYHIPELFFNIKE